MQAPSEVFRRRIAVAARIRLLDLFVSCLQFVEFEIAEILNIDHLIPCLVDRPNQFVELQVDGAGVAVLRVLNEEDHQERNDGCACIDHQLPGVRKVKDRTGGGPDYDDHRRAGKSPFRSQPCRGPRGKASEPVIGGSRLNFDGYLFHALTSTFLAAFFAGTGRCLPHDLLCNAKTKGRCQGTGLHQSLKLPEMVSEAVAQPQMTRNRTRIMMMSRMRLMPPPP